MQTSPLPEMLEVSGVGENKLKKYGQRFLEEIQKFCQDHIVTAGMHTSLIY